MKIPFVGPTNAAQSLNANAERTINCYLEANPAPGRDWALYGTPGLTLRTTLAAGNCRGSIRMGEYTYWVSGYTVYRMDASFNATALGVLATNTGRVGLAQNGTQVLIVDGAYGWLATSSSMVQIADADFPNGVTVALYIDNYFVVFGDGSQRAYWCENPGTGADWNGLDFGSAEANPDPLVGGVADHRQLWLFGTESVEVWAITTDPDALFQRVDGVFIETGTAAAWSPQSIDNSVFWVGANKDGEGIVLRSNGYSPQRISKHSLETAMRGYSTIADAFSWCYQLDGHSFYVLTFPTADATWQYDVATGEWTEWMWRNPSDNTDHRHRANCHVFANRQHLVGDWETGKVYSLEPEVYTDNGDPIRRLRRTQTLSLDGRRQFFSRLFVDMETAVANGDVSAPQVMLRYSNDGGHSWSNPKYKSLGATGEYGRRVVFGPLGSGRNRVWELSMTDAVKFALFGADVDGEAGTN